MGIQLDLGVMSTGQGLPEAYVKISRITKYFDPKRVEIRVSVYLSQYFRDRGDGPLFELIFWTEDSNVEQYFPTTTTDLPSEDVRAYLFLKSLAYFAGATDC